MMVFWHVLSHVSSSKGCTSGERREVRERWKLRLVYNLKRGGKWRGLAGDNMGYFGLLHIPLEVKVEDKGGAEINGRTLMHCLDPLIESWSGCASGWFGCLDQLMWRRVGESFFSFFPHMRGWARMRGCIHVYPFKVTVIPYFFRGGCACEKFLDLLKVMRLRKRKKKA